MTNSEKVTTREIRPNDCKKLWSMLWEAAERAGLKLPRQKRYNPNSGIAGKFAPFDGIYLPDVHSFWCGVIHNEYYQNHIIFCPERENIRKYQFDEAGARWLTKPNYLVEQPHEGMWVPKNPYKHKEYQNNVVFKSSLSEPFFLNSAFFSLESGDDQCEWLSMFMWNAWIDAQKFPPYKD